MTRRIWIFVLAVLLPVLIIIMSISPVAALVIAPSDQQTEEEVTVSAAEATVFGYLGDWQDTMIVSEYYFMDADVLQLYLMVPSMDEVDFDAFSSVFWDMLDAPDLAHERVYLDIVDQTGIRIESYDIDRAALDMERAVFGEELSPQDPEVSNGVEVGFNESFTLGNAELMIKSYQLLQDEFGSYILLTFDFGNNSENTDSAFMMVDYYAEQNGVQLERHYTLDDLNTTYTDIEPGETMPDCLIGFYLTNTSDPVSFMFEEFLGSDKATFFVEIDGVG